MVDEELAKEGRVVVERERRGVQPLEDAGGDDVERMIPHRQYQRRVHLRGRHVDVWMQLVLPKPRPMLHTIQIEEHEDEAEEEVVGDSHDDGEGGRTEEFIAEIVP